MYNTRHRRSKNNGLLIVTITIALLTGCHSNEIISIENKSLEAVAFSDAQWTGLAVSKNGRLFVNYPRWSDDVPVSVAELINGNPIPYPNKAMNAWRPGKAPASHLVCIQALFIDDKNRLWILDPANPQFKGVIRGGAKLLQVDLVTNRKL